MDVDHLTDQKILREQQYRHAEHLNARMQFHELFTVSEKPWFSWLLEKINLQQGEKILELGCGPGNLWLEPQPPRPQDMQYFLTDFSYGMLLSARGNLNQTAFQFVNVDAQHIGMPSHSFDVVVANHCLYHVPDLASALHEIRRVLKPGGRLIAATNGAEHLKGLYDLLSKFDVHYTIQRPQLNFSLENGQAWLSREFSQIECIHYDSALHIRDIQPLLAYYRSLQNMSIDFSQVDQHAFTRFLEDYLATHGMILIKKDVGVFTAMA